MTLSLNDWAVLALVVEEPRHGFAISRELRWDSSLGSIWRVARAQVYRSLNRLVDDGLADWGPVEPGHGPERRVASPTAAGRKAVEDWATTPVDRLRQVRSELVLKLVVARRLGLDVTDLVARQSAVVAEIRARLDEDLATADADRRVALLWRYEAAEAVDRFLATVTRGTAGRRGRGPSGPAPKAPRAESAVDNPRRSRPNVRFDRGADPSAGR